MISNVRNGVEKTSPIYSQSLNCLQEDGELPTAYRAHKLSSEWKGLWECHIEPDWLLIDQVTANEVLLIRTGSHRDLFG